MPAANPHMEVKIGASLAPSFNRTIRQATKQVRGLAHAAGGMGGGGLGSAYPVAAAGGGALVPLAGGGGFYPPVVPSSAMSGLSPMGRGFMSQPLLAGAAGAALLGRGATFDGSWTNMGGAGGGSGGGDGGRGGGRGGFWDRFGRGRRRGGRGGGQGGGQGVGGGSGNRRTKFRGDRDVRNEIRGEITEVLGLGLAFASLIRPAIRFEGQLKEINKAMEFETPEAMGAYGDELRALSREIPVALSGLSDIAFVAGQAGYRGKESIDFTRDVAKLGVAFDMSANKAVDAFMGVRNTMGLTQEGAMRLADTTNYLSNNFNAQAKDIFTVLSYQGALAKQAGLTNEAFMALGATLLSTGSAPEETATALRNVLTAFTSGDALADHRKEALETLGFSAGDLPEMMQKDAVGTIKSVIGAIKDLRKADRGSILTELFQIRGSSTVAKFMEAMDKFDTALELTQVESAGSVVDEFNKRAESTDKYMQRFSTAVESLSMSFTKGLLGPMMNSIEVFTNIAYPIGNLLEAFPRFTTAVVGTGFALVGLRIILVGVRFFVHSFGTVLRGLSIVTYAWSAATWTASVSLAVLKWAVVGVSWSVRMLRLALLGSGIFTIVALIGFAAETIYKNWDDIGPFFRGIGDTIKGVFGWLFKAWQWVSRIGGYVSDFFLGDVKHGIGLEMEVSPEMRDDGFWRSISNWWKNKAEKERERVKKIRKEEQNFIEQTRANDKKALRRIGEFSTDIIKNSAGFVIAGAKLTAGLWKGMNDSFYSTVKGIGKWPGKAVGWWREGPGSLVQDGLDFIGDLNTGMKSKFIDTKAWLKGLPKKMDDSFGIVPGDTYLDAGRKIIGKIQTGLEEKFPGVSNWLKGLPSSMDKSFGIVPGDSYMDAGRRMMNKLQIGLDVTFFKTKTWLNNLPKRLDDSLGVEQGDTYLDAGRKLIEKLRIGLEEKFPGVSDWLRELPASMDKSFGIVPGDSYMDAGRKVIGSLQTGLELTWFKTKVWFSNLSQGMDDSFDIGSGDSYMDAGKKVIGKLQIGLEDSFVGVKDWLKGLPGSMREKIGLSPDAGFSDIGKKMMGTLRFGLLVRFLDVGTWLVNLPSKMLEKLGVSPGDAFMDAGRKIITGLWEGMKETWTDVLGWARGLPGRLAEEMKALPGEMVDAGKEWGRSVWYDLTGKTEEERRKEQGLAPMGGRGRIAPTKEDRLNRLALLSPQKREQYNRINIPITIHGNPDQSMIDRAAEAVLEVVTLGLYQSDDEAAAERGTLTD